MPGRRAAIRRRPVRSGGESHPGRSVIDCQHCQHFRHGGASSSKLANLIQRANPGSVSARIRFHLDQRETTTKGPPEISLSFAAPGLDIRSSPAGGLPLLIFWCSGHSCCASGSTSGIFDISARIRASTSASSWPKSSKNEWSAERRRRSSSSVSSITCTAERLTRGRLRRSGRRPEIPPARDRRLPRRRAV
jgi:hypothetical protein